MQPAEPVGWARRYSLITGGQKRNAHRTQTTSPLRSSVDTPKENGPAGLSPAKNVYSDPPVARQAVQSEAQVEGEGKPFLLPPTKGAAWSETWFGFPPVEAEEL